MTQVGEPVPRLGMSLGTVVAGAMAVGVIAALPAASKPPK
jgi:hypothetical protein